MILTLFRRFAERGFDGDGSGGEGSRGGGRFGDNDNKSGFSSFGDDDDDDDSTQRYIESLLLENSRQHRVAIIATAVFSVVASAFVIWTIWYDNRSKRREDTPQNIPQKLRYNIFHEM